MKRILPGFKPEEMTTQIYASEADVDKIYIAIREIYTKRFYFLVYVEDYYYWIEMGTGHVYSSAYETIYEALMSMFTNSISPQIYQLNNIGELKDFLCEVLRSPEQKVEGES